MSHRRPRCIIVAGPNGAGKTTFAREYLPIVAGVTRFANVDLIAQGLSPFNPDLAAAAAGRVMLREISRLSAAMVDFALESTLSGGGYARQIVEWKKLGYRIAIVYLALESPELALRRISARVRQGGHNVPRADVVRRFERSRDQFDRVYRPLADDWAVHDNSCAEPKLLEPAVTGMPERSSQRTDFAAEVGRGLRLAGRAARVVARRYGTPIYVCENAKVVAKRP